MLLAKKFKLLFMLPLLLICLAAATEAQAGSELVVTGKVVDAKGAAVPGYLVTYYEVVGNNYRMRIINGRLANPKAVTDASGKFTIKVDLGTFTSEGGFALLAKRSVPGANTFRLKDAQGKPMKFALPADRGNPMDLGALRLQ